MVDVEKNGEIDALPADIGKEDIELAIDRLEKIYLENNKKL